MKNSWLLKNTPSLLVDLYELTMAQAYYEKGLNDTSYFEVFVRSLPPDWGYFVMAGLNEIESYLKEFKFSQDDIAYLESTKIFSANFLSFLAELKPDVKIRAMPEGRIFFPNEPVLEVEGPLVDAQILESYILNILGFSIIEATLGTRVVLAAKGRPVIDFGLRRTQGPVASLRSARGAQIANFSATSNLLAAKLLDFSPSGTMAHSFIQVHQSEESAFINFIDVYGEKSILLVDTYDSVKGIEIAASVAKHEFKEKNIKIKGIRIDSGDFVYLSKFARKHFEKQGVSFLKIFISGGLDEYSIEDILSKGAEIDGFGVGTRFATSNAAPNVDIAYKLIEYKNRGIFKKSPEKETYPGRKSVFRKMDKVFQGDTVLPYCEGNDLLVPFKTDEDIATIKKRLSEDMSNLDDSIKQISKPQKYPVEFKF